MITKKSSKECEVISKWQNIWHLFFKVTDLVYTGIFAQASKSLDEYRAEIANQKEQISHFQTSASDNEEKLDETIGELNTSKGMN
jgi:hypothetical protein